MDLFGYGGMDIDWDAIDWSSIFPDVTTTEQPQTTPAPVVQPQPVVQPVQQQKQQEEVVSLASPFDADPFVPEAVAPQPTPAPVVQPEPTPAPVAQQQQQPNGSAIPSGGLIPESVTALLPTIWSEEQQEFIPNPAKAALDASLTPEEVQASFQQAQEEAEAKYASGELIRPPAGLDGGSSLFYNQANQLITRHGVSSEDAQNWLNNALEELEKVGTPDYDYNSIQQAQQQLIGESYLNTTNQWFSELDNLKTDDVSLFTEKYDDMPVQSRLQYLYHLYDEGELSEDKYKELFKTTLNSAYDKEKNPHGNIIIELEGQEFLVNGFNVQGVGPSDSFKQPTFLASSAYFADDSLYFPKDDSAYGQAEFFKNIHRTGGKTRASDKVSDILEPSSWEWFLTNPVTNIAASIIPGGQLVMTALKAATPDVDIDPLQAAGGLLQGLNMAGVTEPPSTTPLPAGQVGPPAPNAGTGLFGTTYGQTEALLNAAATGDIKETAVGMFGGDLINQGLAQAGIEASNLGLTPEQLESSIDTTAMALAQGNELDEALARGFGQEVLEGVVGAIPETEVDFGIIEDTIKPIVETVIDTAETIAEPFVEVVKEAGPKVEDAIRATGELVEPFVEPIIDVAETVGPEVEDVVRELGSTADDVLIQPVVEAAETVGPEIENIIREVGSETEDIVRAVGGEVIEVVSPIGEAIEDIAKVTGSTVEDVLKGVEEITGEAVETLGEAISPIGKTIEDIAKTTGSTVEDVLEGVGEIGEGVVETVGEAIEAGVETIDELLSPIGSAVEDIARATGSTVEDVLRGVGSLTDDIREDIGELGQDVIDALSPIGSALEDVVRATGSTLEDLLKSLANMVSGAFGSLALQQQEQARQQRIQSALDTRTTDSLFGDELFQFQTEIGISPEYLETVEPIEPPEEFVDILGSQGTGLDYNYILEDLTKPRSYSF